jgi:FkbM family methyltransferase
MKGVAFNEPERALDQIEENIAHGAAIYAPTAFKMYDTGINTVLSANYPQVSDGRFLKVVRKIGDYHLTLDADNHHERDYYLAEKNNKLAVDALVAQRFIHAGDCVLDAGANIGYTSLRYLASGAGQVHAFEPVEYVYSRLAEVASDRLHVYPLALSNENVTGSMIVSTKHRQGSTLKQSMIDRFPDVFGEQHVEQAVKVVRLDDELPNVEFDFMKLDVEGAEADCLRGAVNHLLSPRLRIVQVELYDSYFAEVDDILTHYFSYIYRIAVKISSNELVLLALDVPEAETEGLRIQPPMYLYSRDELV